MMAGMKEGPRFRQAREDDRFLIAQEISVWLPPFTSSDGIEFEGISCRMLWHVKSKDLHVELNETNLRYIFAALECSDPIEKKEKAPKGEQDAPKSPRKRRRLKRRKSQESEGASHPADAQEGASHGPE
jgi:hypothetical protein